MAKKTTSDKKELLEQLPRVKYEKQEEKGSGFLEKMSLARALLALAEIDHEHEYELCKAVAGQILETVPEPDDIDLEED